VNARPTLRPTQQSSLYRQRRRCTINVVNYAYNTQTYGDRTQYDLLLFVERNACIREVVPIGTRETCPELGSAASADGKKQSRVIGVEYWNAGARDITSLYRRRLQWRQWQATVDCKLGINSTHGAMRVRVCARVRIALISA
jgi:hypothetical protein